jgi:translation initiation factor IF-3
MNNQIDAPFVYLIDHEGNRLGRVPTDEALRLADDASCDLVEVSLNESENVPVCRILDYSKHLFELGKKASAQRKKQKQMKIKEIKLRPVTADNDFKIKLDKLIGFLKDGDKVKVSIQFKRRETNDGSLIAKLKAEIENHGEIDTPPTNEGRQIIMVIAPKKKNG